ncbi:hypothetical protein Tco_0008792, partial [Tanacetum coccineum]
MSSKGKSQSGAIKIGALVNFLLSILKDSIHSFEKITGVAIEETIGLVSRESFEYLIHKGQLEMVFSGGFIQLSIVNAHSLPCDQSGQDQFIIIILDDGYAT